CIRDRRVNGQVVETPGKLFAPDVEIVVQTPPKYVSRGGFKLEAALEAFQIEPAGLVALDLGSSTGGFTDCLLQHGARRVHAVDVGRGQLHWRLRSDPRVVVHEGLNARHLQLSDIGETAQLATADLSFISLALILPAAWSLLEPDSSMVLLIKPQFELSPAEVGGGGIVRDASARLRAAEKIRDFVRAAGKVWLGCIECPVPGRDGNIEWLAHIRA
ncbi:MAG: TlyA family RNA methyltransferase, partial [Terrimicrobiaceae bacterium]|nr:TlyA family RNA methyltransferase [Terrimicrobiaceae bacterium]